jgi:hypothetical protein
MKVAHPIDRVQPIRLSSSVLDSFPWHSEAIRLCNDLGDAVVESTAFQV